MKNVCLITNDVEDLSISGLSFDKIGNEVCEKIIPQMLCLYDKYNVKATFFVVAEFAKKHPQTIKQIENAGHEIACHGLIHNENKAFDLMTYEEQVRHLQEAKQVLEEIVEKKVVSFRAPALRINEFTSLALQKTGFKFDSSIAPQRMDAFMSLGSRNKLQWLKAPRLPYKADENNLAQKGNSSIFEVPVSSFVLPYIGTLMRISPLLNKIVRYFLYLETKNTRKAINFLFHPSEAVPENNEQTSIRKRSNNYFSHLFSDILRVKLKQRNLNENALKLFEKELQFWSKKGYSFLTIQQFLEGKTI